MTVLANYSFRCLGALAVGAIISICAATPGYAFDWDYSHVKYDLTTDAVLGSAQDFQAWTSEPRKYLKEKFEAAITIEPQVVAVGKPRAMVGYTLTDVDLLFPAVEKNGSDLHMVLLLARPNRPKDGPAIVAMNGHGEVGGEGHGQAPEGLFKPGAQGDKLARDGFTVIGIPDAIHEPFSELAKTVDYPVIWARLADRSLDKIKPMLPEGQKFIALGNAVGGLSSLVLTAMRDDVIALANNGAFFSLEQTRREYRIYTHPFCHDFRAFFTYTAVYALIAPKPLLIEEGKTDALWLGAPQQLKPNDWFSGTKRGPISDEIIGAYLQLKQIWSKFDAPIALDIHDGGHEDFDIPAFKSFVGQLQATHIQ
ncbi:hypothetical protein [Rhizobium sp. BR 249]|uniref:hypothetical protein n=1 Tax=Rhizobium sp. BR 249 TaxID=3040011 RepID=UPI0039BFC46B